MPYSAVRLLTNWKKSEIPHFFKRSFRLCRHPGLDVRVAPTGHHVGRILIITPRKSGNAVERNRFKRRIRSIFYTEKLFQKGFDWIVLAKKEGVALNFQQLKTFLLTVSSALPCLPSLES